MALHDAPARFAHCYANLQTYLPHYDRILLGRVAVLSYLHDVLCIRRPNGSPLKWRTVLRWTRECGFPLLRAGWMSFPSNRLTPCLTSSHALTAWVLAQFSTATKRSLFSVATPAPSGRDGNAPEQSGMIRIGAVIVRDAA